MNIGNGALDRTNGVAVERAHQIAEVVQTAQNLSRGFFGVLERFGVPPGILAGGHERIKGELHASFDFSERGAAGIQFALLVQVARGIERRIRELQC